MRAGFSTLRTELRQLLVIPSLAPHPVHPNGQVQTDDVRRFGFEIRIVAGHIPFQPRRFQSSLSQNPLYGGLAEPQLVGQFPAGPVGAAVPGLLLYSPDHPGLHRRCSRI